MFDLINDGEWVGRYETIDAAIAKVTTWRRDFEAEMVAGEYEFTEDDFNWDLIEVLQVVLAGDEVKDKVLKNRS